MGKRYKHERCKHMRAKETILRTSAHFITAEIQTHGFFFIRVKLTLTLVLAPSQKCMLKNLL